MRNRKNFFLSAPLALWGCVSIWLSNLVRLASEDLVPYAWASLFFSYGIVALYYIQLSEFFRDHNTTPKAKSAWILLGVATLFLIASIVLAIQ